MNLLFLTICALCTLCYGSKLIVPNQANADIGDESSVNALPYDLFGPIRSYRARCLQVLGGAADNTLVGFADCISNSNQQWILPARDNTIRSLGKCLTSSNELISGTDVYMYECTGEDNQKWAVTTTGLIANFATGHCLDAYVDPRGVTYWCDGTITQTFILPSNMS